MARVLHDPPFVPGPIKRHLVAETNRRMADVNAMAEAVRTGSEHDLSDRIGTLAVRTLILWGGSDRVVPFAVAQAYADRIPDASLVLLPEAGHSPQIEAPERVAEAIAAFTK